jgi:hypothetical protein
MRRMNDKAHKGQHSHALQNHKHFKGAGNTAPRMQSKKEIEQEVASL